MGVNVENFRADATSIVMCVTPLDSCFTYVRTCVYVMRIHAYVNTLIISMSLHTVLIDSNDPQTHIQYISLECYGIMYTRITHTVHTLCNSLGRVYLRMY